MTKHKDTVPAAPDTSATPPVTDTGTGTSHAPDATLAGDGSGDALPPVTYELKELAPSPKPVPGAADFDIYAPGVSSADLQEHLSILSLRKQLADLDRPAPVPAAVAEAPVAATPLPLSASDIVAVHPELGTRGFSAITWAAMETQGEHGGWQQQVTKPTDL